ncbi:tyrosine-type recombinase/integrase [Tepidamorphus sp. 3E244]|uniref:tyrosine-type recombinase/integrase n=1 Tax=Tepidamorphus sp. 3E244 TaxID=3385498 RepID=UPI0038FC3797
MTINLVSIWHLYKDIAWENTPHKTTCEAYILEMQNIIDQRKLTEIDTQLVDHFRAEFRSRGNRNSTINRKLSCLGKLLRRHQRAGQLSHLPDMSKFPERNGRVRFLSSAEEKHLFSKIGLFDPRYEDLCIFLVNTAARIGEAVQVRWSDVTDTTVTFWETKAGLPRTIPLTDAAAEALSRQTSRNAIGPFASIKYPKFRYAWNKAKQEAGLGADPQVVPHILRHTCASRLVQSGIDIKRVQDFLGHKTISMTLRYAHLAPSHLNECAAVLNKLGEDTRRTIGSETD